MAVVVAVAAVAATCVGGPAGVGVAKVARVYFRYLIN